MRLRGGERPGGPPTLPERVVIGLAAVALAFGAIAALSGYFAGKDQAGIAGVSTGPGAAYADQGHAALAPGAARPVYDSSPPTSGPHLAADVSRDQSPLSTDQLLQALQLGDVVVMYRGPEPPPGLTALARRVAAPFSPALAVTGQALILAPRSGTVGLIGLAWTHIVHVSSASDPLLRQFASYWLGRGAPRRR